MLELFCHYLFHSLSLLEPFFLFYLILFFSLIILFFFSARSAKYSNPRTLAKYAEICLVKSTGGHINQRVALGSRRKARPANNIA